MFSIKSIASLLFFIYLFTPLSVFSYSPLEEWSVESKGGYGQFSASAGCTSISASSSASASARNAVASGSDGGSVVVGCTEISGVPYIYVRRYNADGVTVWSHRQSYTNSSIATRSVIVDLDHEGNTYVVGHVAVANQFMAMKYDFHGQLLWAKEVNQPERFLPLLVKHDGSGGMYVAGSGYAGQSDRSRYTYIQRVSREGDLIWSLDVGIGGHINDFPVDMIVSNDNSLNVAVNLRSKLLKINQNGSVIWTVSGDSSSFGKAIALGEDGSIYLTGHISSVSYRSDYFIEKYASHGIRLWHQRTSAQPTERWVPQQLLTGRHGEIFLGGIYVKDSAENSGTFLSKYDHVGNKEWVSKNLNDAPGRMMDFRFSMSFDKNHKIYILETKASHVGTTSMVTNYKISSYFESGELDWFMENPESRVDKAISVAVSGAGRLGVHLFSHELNADIGYWTSMVYGVSGTGQLEWTRSHSETGLGEWMAASSPSLSVTGFDEDENYYSIGRSREGILYNGTNYMVSTRSLLMKVDKAGRMLWQKHSDDLFDLAALYAGLHVSASGESYVSGVAFNYLHGNVARILKFNQSGEQEWARLFLPEEVVNSGYSTFIGGDSYGDVYVVANFSRPIYSDMAYVLKYDRNGDLLWDKRLSSFQSTVVSVFEVMPDGSHYIAGHFRASISEGRVLFIEKRDRDGNPLWGHAFAGGSSSRNNIVGLRVGNDGLVYLAGSVYHNFRNKVFASKFSQDGEMLWINHLSNGSFVLNPVDIELNFNENIAVSGHRPSDGAAFIFQVNSSGDLIENKYFLEDGLNLEVSDMNVDAAGNFFVGGKAVDESGDENSFLIKHAPAGEDGWFYHRVLQENEESKLKNVDISSEGNIIINGTKHQETESSRIFVSKIFEPIRTSLAITDHSPDPTRSGQPYEVAFSVSADAGVPTGMVHVNDGARQSCGPVVLESGSGRCTIASTVAGIRRLTAQYFPDDMSFSGASGFANHRVITDSVFSDGFERSPVSE